MSELLPEMNEGVYGGHPKARTLAERIINLGFYWPIQRKDVKTYVKSYDTFKIFWNIPQLSSIEQIPIVVTWPFDMWGMDLIRKFPKTQNGYEYLIVRVDYFSK